MRWKMCSLNFRKKKNLKLHDNDHLKGKSHQEGTSLITFCNFNRRGKGKRTKRKKRFNRLVNTVLRDPQEFSTAGYLPWQRNWRSYHKNWLTRHPHDLSSTRSTFEIANLANKRHGILFFYFSFFVIVHMIKRNECTTTHRFREM